MPFRHAAILAHCAGGQQPTRDRSVKNRTESRGRRGAWSSHGQPDGIAEKWLGGCSADGVTRIPRIRAGRGYAGLYRGELRENRGPQRRGAAWRTLLGSFGMGSYCGALTWVRSSVLGRNIARRDVVLLLSMVEGRACESNRARRADLTVKMCLTPCTGALGQPGAGAAPPASPPHPFCPGAHTKWHKHQPPRSIRTLAVSDPPGGPTTHTFSSSGSVGSEKRARAVSPPVSYLLYIVRSVPGRKPCRASSASTATPSSPTTR